MVESDSDTEKVKISEHNFSQGGSQGSVFPREPSFSGWCDEDGAIRTDGKRHLDGQRERNQQERMQVNGGNNEDGASAHGLRNANGKRLPFDIENGSGKDQNIPNSVHTGFNSVDNHGTSESKK
ncbi:nucleotide/sugar transporter family protein [Actinidia rufa]|uniref:Nucleotide/sugar transporter family protein n=1 Tax=Actinidia rufa TaxID=165716 RepID=A0A7J0DYM9_9ERIC|nr:nucleotide/sugar transporter family protein [Actinidia rufa]